MKNKILLAFTVVLLSVSFILGATGVIDLSRTPQTDRRNTSDRLIGVMITKEHLELFDIEAYFNDHAKDIIKGNQIIDNTGEYDQRIYAELRDVATTDSETGEDVHTKEYVFPDVDGLYMYTATVRNEHDSYQTCISGAGISDLKSGSHYKDDGEEQTLEATIYTTADSELYTVYANPVYQTETGEVYLIAGTGIAGQGGITQTLKETTTFTEDGEKRSYTAEIIIHREQVEAVREITVEQFTETHELLYSDTYPIDQMPEAITVNAQTTYMLIQETTQEDTGSYRLLQPTDESFDVFKADSQGICEKVPIEILWSAATDFTL